MSTDLLERRAAVAPPTSAAPSSVEGTAADRIVNVALAEWQATALLGDAPFGLPELLERRWRFTVGHEHVLNHALQLRADGRIDGHSNPNEASWGFDADGMALYAADGRASTRFERIEREGAKVRLIGRFVLQGGRGAVHVLESTTLTIAEAARLPELVDFDGLRVRLRASPRVVAALERHRISFGRHHERLKPSQVLSFGLASCTEPYAGFPVGTTIGALGAFSYSESELPPELQVGRYCSIAMGVQVFLDRHPLEWATSSSITYDFAARGGYTAFIDAHRDFNGEAFAPTPPERRFDPLPTIGHDVWIGQSAQIARNVHIGTGAVVAAGAIVTKDVPPYAIVAGVPARVVRMRFEPAVVARLLASRWWEYDVSILKRCDYRDPELFAAQVEQAARRGLPRYTPEPLTGAGLLAELVRLPI